MDGLGIAGFFVIFGHMFPIFEKFKGGKGVACLAIVALITSIFTNNWIAPFIPFTFLILLIIFIIIVIGTRYVSMASVIVALLYPVFLHSLSGPNAGLCVAMAIMSAVFVAVKHKENLKRIWDRTESKISFQKTSKKKIEKTEDGKGDAS